MRVDKSIRQFSVFESDRSKVVEAAIAWQRVMCFEDDAKPGNNYYKVRSDMEAKVFDELVYAVERFRKSHKVI